jgi:hypothetical protein
MSFQILTAANVKMTVCWDIAPCSRAETDRRFRGAYCVLNVCQFLPDYTAQYPWRQSPSVSHDLLEPTKREKSSFKFAKVKE